VLVAAQRHGSVRAQPVKNDSIVNMSPMIQQFLSPEAQIMSDQHQAFRKIAMSYADHQTVNHLRKEYVRNDVHVNTIESFNSLLERVKLGVFHHMSPKHLTRYLNEISFRWNHRIPEERVSKNGRKKIVMRPMPFMLMLTSLLAKAAGRQLRKTSNNGFRVLNAQAMA
jgi:hypothetical protein